MLNRVQLIGKVTKTPEIMENKDGKKFTILNVTVPRNFKNEKGEYETDFIDCTAYGKVTENICEHVKKGYTIAINGRIQNLSNTAQLQIIAERISFLSSKGE